jgi:hypothetical protein
VRDPNGLAGCDRLVRGTDPTKRRSELSRSCSLLTRGVEQAVPGEDERRAVPRRSASGVLSLTGTPGRSLKGGGGMKNQPIGSSKARAKATISSASKLRTNLPAMERSAWETLALDQRLPR